jgi:chromosomal replication initiation ATPase DnaA
MTAPRQLIFDLGHRPALEAEDFLVAASNEAAVALIDSWPDWPAPSALVMGPPRAGKTHLAHVWQKRTGAPIVAARDLGEASIGTLQANHALVIEDLDMGIGSEAALFHLMNLAREHGWHLLLTSRIAAGEIQVALPDLRSRLRAAILVEIAPPDDGLLGAVLVKHFADRQLAVEPQVISWLAANMERTLDAAAAIVEDIDKLALASRRRVTRTLAAEAVLARAGGTR